MDCWVGEGGGGECSLYCGEAGVPLQEVGCRGEEEEGSRTEEGGSWGPGCSETGRKSLVDTGSKRAVDRAVGWLGDGTLGWLAGKAEGWLAGRADGANYQPCQQASLAGWPAS